MLRSALLALGILFAAIMGVIWTMVRSSALHMRSERQWQQRMRRKLLETAESERRLMAAELHDDIVQRLVLLGHSVIAMDETDRRFGGIAEELFDAAESVRLVAHQVHPQEAGLVRIGTTLQRVVDEMQVIGLSVKVYGPLEVDDGLDPATRVAVLRVVQEALRNVRQHSRVEEAVVNLAVDPVEVRLAVLDAGQGFDPQTVRKGLGMACMRDRIAGIGGMLDIDSNANVGTTVTVRIPRNV